MARPAQRKRTFAVENASLGDMVRALGDGKVTASDLARAYLARIKAYDSGGPRLNSVREINPDALSIAAGLDGVKPSARQPLAGVPILLKDNIATGDRQHTTAGSLALASARARHDATV
ncbi:MAG TPA: amidase family protein, partial [Reyranella sp.]|nr:amidase family protein [Reyranella sp.]